MKTTTAIFISILTSLIGLFLGLSVRTVDFTDNIKDCLSKGGEYYIHIEDNTTWNYEKCTIEKEINYSVI